MDVRLWSRRLNLILTISLVAGVSLVGRLYQKSIIEHTQSVKAAENQYAFRQEVFGRRGDILLYDPALGRTVPVAQNERRFQVLVVPKNVKQKRQTAQQLAKVLGLDEAKLYDTIKTDKKYAPPIKRRISRAQADIVAGLKLDGVYIQPELVRIYPEQTLASQLLGFVNLNDQGNYGIEGTYDAILKGSSGYRVGEKDNRGQLITLEDEVEAKNGADIVLTLDRDIQHFVERSLTDAVKKFEADSGSVVIINPKTGAVVAMASVPNYNPNQFNTVDDPAKFVNPTVAAVWEPGSIAKPLIMALAVDKDLVDPDTKATFGASVRVGNHEIFTAEKKAFGEQTMTQVLENSDNVAMVWLSEKLGNSTQYEGLKNFGFGEAPEIKLQNVVSGVLPPLKNWSEVGRANMAFGQGFSCTPLQMAMAYGALANQGKLMTPFLVSEIRDATGTLVKTEPKPVRQVVSPDTANALVIMLESVVVRGHAKRAGVAGFRVGGKTGTAQVPNPEGGYFEDRHIGSLAGFFPLSDPQYAMVVKLDQPKTVKFAESSAGPTFGEIAKWIMLHKQLKPDGAS